ncbi:cory-CC-star protein [Gulosibacter hominis]|uniref:cory-CC-star protein n=1 Tax=Gulosibacter hominis TaxID=2770504 RepID=UPI002EDA3CE5
MSPQPHSGGGEQPDSPSPGWPQFVAWLREKFGAFSAGLNEYYVGPYRQTMKRAERDEDDLLMLYIYGEALGIPGPANYYLMELYPVLLDELHEWHTRVGLERSPIAGARCC